LKEEPEIVVTPTMLGAGIIALGMGASDEQTAPKEWPKATITAIYHAMETARRMEVALTSGNNAQK